MNIKTAHSFTNTEIPCRLCPSPWWVISLLFLAALPLWAQFSQEDGTDQDPTLLIGISLGAVYSRYGVPESVYAVRGAEEWQDDVVFVYHDWDLYVFQDRVWQVGPKAAFGINLADPQGVVPLALGEGVQVYEGYMLYSLPARSWPLVLRVNIEAGKVAAIFIYRSDF